MAPTDMSSVDSMNVLWVRVGQGHGGDEVLAELTLTSEVVRAHES